MSALLLIILAIVIFVVAYLTYGRYLAKTWGLDPSKKTPAYELEDGVDYCPAKTPVLMGHHFSSIAGAGPINGPIQAAFFGWVPCFLWIVIGGIFFGAVQDFGALFVSIRHEGKSLGEVIEDNIGHRTRILFTVFAWLVLLLVIAAFGDIVANSFIGASHGGSASNGSVATASLLFIPLAIGFGFLVYRKNAPMAVATVLGVVLLAACVAIGLVCPLDLPKNFWIGFVFVYIIIASVTPVWILLQPRDYLSSFLLYFMMAAAVIGIIGATIVNPASTTFQTPAFTGFAVNGNFLFPTLFITIACGAISGFHSLVGSGTTAKQLNSEKDAQPIAYGGMLIECALAIISLCAVGYIWSSYSAGETVVPTAVFATGISKMLGSIPGLAGTEKIAYTLLVLTVSVFCLTSLDTATRLARYMFQEFWLEPGETYKDVTGYKKVLTNPFVATLITVVLGIGLGITGYANIWPLFGAANQLLAALGLLAVATWLGKAGKNNKMFYIPMAFMLIVTITSLCFTIKSNVLGVMAGGEGTTWCLVRAVIAVLLVALAIVLAVDGVKTMMNQKKEA